MLIQVYHSETGQPGSFILHSVEEAYPLSLSRDAGQQATVWVGGLGTLKIGCPTPIGYEWWVLIVAADPDPTSSVEAWTAAGAGVSRDTASPLSA